MIPLSPNRPRAPEFPAGFAWWNTGRPLSLRGDLKGRVVILDFWTYCCINCLHVLASLEKVEEHYKGRPVAVIGVHSNKFANEAPPSHIRQAILRNRIRHPIIVDEGHQMWNQYGVAAWPTLVLIDAEGRVVGAMAGEIAPEQLEVIVDSLLEEGQNKGTLVADTSLALRPESMIPSASGLAYPGKVITDPGGEYLFIADSNHNRILMTDPSGEIVEVIGSGERGSADGTLAEAQFFDPQGMAIDARHSHLYVADLGNHLIRRVDLKLSRVETVLGTGRQQYDRVGGRCGTEQGLDSPWDLAVVDNDLFIAMAGTHQIWRMDLSSGLAAAWAGSGREGLIDGPGPNAALAQPSGLVRLGDYLYFADSEASALRRVSLRGASVDTLVGHGLFDFGDADGAWGRARLQHPLGVATDGRRLFLADTYNHKVKIVYLDDRTVKTLAGSGQPGVGVPEGPLELNEPGGLACIEETLFIADTNNHRIVALDVLGGAWRELVIRQPRKILVDEEVTGYPVSAKVGSDLQELILEIEPALVEGFELNPAAPQTLVIWEPMGDYEGSLLGAAQIQRTTCAGEFPLHIALPLPREKPEAGEFMVDLSFATCTAGDHEICKPEYRRWDVHWRLAKHDGHELRLVGGMVGVQ